MKTSQILRVIWLSVLLLLPVSELVAQESRPKREFRGAWIQCVNGQFLGLGTQEMQRTLSYQLDELQKDGVNAIIFQVRAECDALYASRYEPWSRFLTGRQGTPPSPYWDPLQWMIASVTAAAWSSTPGSIPIVRRRRTRASWPSTTSP